MRAMSKVFLSHSHRDKSFARRLGALLRRHGHIVWIDEAEILVGDSLIAKIVEGIEFVDYVLAIISHASVRSAWVQCELDIASTREIEQKRVIVLPVLIDNVAVPTFLQSKKYCDLRSRSLAREHVDPLLNRLGAKTAIPTLDKTSARQLISDAKAVKRFAHEASDGAPNQIKLGFPVKKSASLVASIRKENKAQPEYAPFNNAYAFSALAQPVTLGRLLWALSSQKMGRPAVLLAAISLDEKWPYALRMMEAYADAMGTGQFRS